MKVLVVNTANGSGGAERMAQRLADGLADRGVDARIAVGFVQREGPGVVALSRRRDGPSHNPAAPPPAGPDDRKWALRSGLEDFFYPATWDLLGCDGWRPDLVHLHNLHGGYFDLRVLPWLSGEVPVVLTLHDQWLLTGHCAHPIGCDRWRTGCGDCPDLGLYPPIPVDNTANNHRRKGEIFSASRLWLTAPSRWLLDRALSSHLAPAVRGARCLPNGIDLTAFTPGDRSAARRRLNLTEDAFVMLFAANGGHSNPWRDFPAMLEVFRRTAGRLTGRTCRLLVLGLREGNGDLGDPRIEPVPFVEDMADLADHYRAADAYLHIARADTFPSVVLEAMACGTPVAANAVGGIPEQVPSGEAGFLFPTGALEEAVAFLVTLANDAALGARLGANAARHARRFDAEVWVDSHLDWYRDILAGQDAGGDRRR